MSGMEIIQDIIGRTVTSTSCKMRKANVVGF